MPIHSIIIFIYKLYDMEINDVRELTKLMDSLYSWDILDENTFTAIRYREYPYDDSINYEVPTSILASLHPNFPEALRAQIEWTQKNRSPALLLCYGSAVCDNLDLLKKGSYPFTDINGIAHKLVNIYKIMLNDDARSIFIMGSQCDIQTIESDGRLVEFVTTSRSYYGADVDIAELDRHYPGWKHRWEIGQNLGLVNEELMAYVFERSIPEITMQNITFENQNL